MNKDRKENNIRDNEEQRLMFNYSYRLTRKKHGQMNEREFLKQIEIDLINI